MPAPLDFSFRTTVGEQFREARRQNRFFTLLANRLDELAASTARTAETRLEFTGPSPFEARIGDPAFTTGWIEIHTDEDRITVEYFISFRRTVRGVFLALIPVALMLAMIPSRMHFGLLLLTVMGPFMAGLLAVSIAIGVSRFRNLVRNQIASS